MTPYWTRCWTERSAGLEDESSSPWETRTSICHLRSSFSFLQETQRWEVLSRECKLIREYLRAFWMVNIYKERIIKKPFVCILVKFRSSLRRNNFFNWCVLCMQVEFPPDLCSRVTFVNFTVTRSSLQSQCLNKVLKAERPDVDEKRSDLLKLQGETEDGNIHNVTA